MITDFQYCPTLNSIMQIIKLSNKEKMESIGYTRRYYEHNEDQESYTSRVGTEKQKEESANPEFSNIKNKKSKESCLK